MPPPRSSSFTVNGRIYFTPARPVAVICLDGSSDEYLDAALVRGRMPNLQRLCVEGHRGLARGAMPSFTNVNNASIVTGVPPSVHGIGGNFFYDTASGQEVMMNSARFLRAETIPAGAARAGLKVAVVTAKEKLRDIFAHGLIEAKGIAFSSEKAGQAQLATHGIDNVEKLVGRPTPPIYSAEASLYVLRAGVALLRAGQASLLYLSTTDYVQHKHAPETAEALDFYAAIDRELGELQKLGAIIGLTADHGMNAKQRPDGSPNVLYLESLLTEKYGPGFRVILPITDPYVVHHGALGSFAVVHLPAEFSARRKFNVLHFLNHLPGVTEVYGRNAAEKLELPADRLGDIVVISGRDVVLGRTPEYHDLKAIQSGLRSHGGRYEEMVPFLLSEPLKPEYQARAAGDPRNFEIFDFALNGLSSRSREE
ncbi:MAG: phosphonoacetate hydrolase [Verrucomicrobia bacterium]|nr:phosphonoacetate hydrolase [Verrucomicrobiota bacterium]